MSKGLENVLEGGAGVVELLDHPDFGLEVVVWTEKDGKR